jgi:hypothetical protein
MRDGGSHRPACVLFFILQPDDDTFQAFPGVTNSDKDRFHLWQGNLDAEVGT